MIRIHRFSSTRSIRRHRCGRISLFAAARKDRRWSKLRRFFNGQRSKTAWSPEQAGFHYRHGDCGCRGRSRRAESLINAEEVPSVDDILQQHYARLTTDEKKVIFARLENEISSKYGVKAIIMARFVPILRAFTPFAAGMVAMSYQKFLSFSILASFIWVTSIVYLGYFFSNVVFIQENFSYFIVAIILASILPATIELIKKNTFTLKNKN